MKARLAILIFVTGCAAQPPPPVQKIETPPPQPAKVEETPIPACVRDHVADVRCGAYAGTGAAEATIRSSPDADVYQAGKKIGHTPISRRKFPLGCVELIYVFGDGTCQAKQFTVDDPEKLHFMAN